MPWVKGQSGNLAGRGPARKTVAERTVEELCRKDTQKNIRGLQALRDDPEQPGQVRLAAIVHLMDRGYGKPAQTVNANVRGQYWIADAPITADEWAFEFAPKPDETTVQ